MGRFKRYAFLRVGRLLNLDSRPNYDRTPLLFALKAGGYSKVNIGRLLRSHYGVNYHPDAENVRNARPPIERFLLIHVT